MSAAVPGVGTPTSEVALRCGLMLARTERNLRRTLVCRFLVKAKWHHVNFWKGVDTIPFMPFRLGKDFLGVLCLQTVGKPVQASSASWRND